LLQEERLLEVFEGALKSQIYAEERLWLTQAATGATAAAAGQATANEAAAHIAAGAVQQLPAAPAAAIEHQQQTLPEQTQVTELDLRQALQQRLQQQRQQQAQQQEQQQQEQRQGHQRTQRGPSPILTPPSGEQITWITHKFVL
jgi:hypothetical protein